MNTSDILFEEMSGVDGSLGLMTLNRPQALNSLNHTMILAMHAQLQTWEKANHIKAVVIRAVPGKAFCAGGDLRLIYSHKQTNHPAATKFFYDEYQLNRFIFHYPKPYIALLDGITMGGGVGISIHGSHRVVTEKLIFGMPETTIGFFPDIGGTYFLPRLPHHLGYYLGLTGARLNSQDCVALGIGTIQVKSEALPEIVEKLAQTSMRNEAHRVVSAVLEDFKTFADQSNLMHQQKLIDQCFSLETMEEILQKLEKGTDTFSTDTLATLAKKSPTSLKVTLRALHLGSELDFDSCMRQEYRMTCRFLQSHDFIEGIRALIIDKDQSPHWKPRRLQDVAVEQVEDYFSPIAKELL